MIRTRALTCLVVLVLTGCSSSSPTETSAGPSPTPPPTATPTTTPLSLDDAAQAIVGQLGDDASANVLVLVNQDLYDPLAPELATLEEDMRNEAWHPVSSIMPTTTAEELRGFLHSIYAHKPFAGVFLVGTFPYAESSAYLDQGADWAGPADHYLMDLDGTWTDANKDGIYDALSDGAGDRKPEIFIGRLNAEHVDIFNESEVDLMKDYFDRDHAYRTGNLSAQDAAIYATYAHHHYGRYEATSATWSQNEIDSIVGLTAETYAFVFDDEAGSDEWPTEFWNVSSSDERSEVIAQQEFITLMSDGYTYLSIGIHGWHEGWGGLFTNVDVLSVLDSGGQLPLFVSSSSCSTGDIALENDIGSTLTLGGSLIFFGFAVPSEITWEEIVVYNEALADLPVGPALLETQTYSISVDSAPIPSSVNWILLGDPTLRVGVSTAS
ncbi:MAG: hypothetical protein JW722_08335 [Demequinaceae bacterium]|nr:hypothetical protein [Demequinaceae bacterium]